MTGLERWQQDVGVGLSRLCRGWRRLRDSWWWDVGGHRCRFVWICWRLVRSLLWEWRHGCWFVFNLLVRGWWELGLMGFGPWMGSWMEVGLGTWSMGDGLFGVLVVWTLDTNNVWLC
ncbi:hypothetical protein [Candidatus Hodgkinia cicadicola]|uniref:hypothetical protein n=1 Tax=Candidatus Hodgkinia cicadicola TaxID=573658 RepID=UPI0011BA82F2